MNPLMDNRYIYTAADAVQKSWQWQSMIFGQMANLFDTRKTSSPLPGFLQDNEALQTMRRTISAKYRILHDLTRHYDKPEWNIVGAEEEIIFSQPFCDLLHFKQAKTQGKPKLLMVAPMAGHFSTLLRGTVQDALPHFDVYITDWKNARDVPISCGAFDLDSYIAYLVNFFEELGPDLHVLGVCQAGVPAYAAIAMMEDHEIMKDKAPKSLTIMGSPIDTRNSPTSVNKYAMTTNEDWFEDNVLCVVPDGYEGEKRLVYPGFMQLGAFWSMNPELHTKSIGSAIEHYIQGAFEQEEKIHEFYSEYCSVMDMTAEFYLQTVRIVFKDYLLPKGEMVSRGRPVKPEAIKNTAILAVEGGKDDVTGVGQTKAALDLAVKLPESKKDYLLLEDSGHYGLFNGSRYRKQVLPALVKFTKKAGV